MFTVLFKSRNGFEELFPAEKVYFRALMGQPNRDPDGNWRGTIVIIPPAGTAQETIQYSDGDFYVMNENGKTVAGYHLYSELTESLPDS